MANLNEWRVSYDGEYLTISPITYSVATKVLDRLDISEMLTTFGVDTLAVTPTKFNPMIPTFRRI